MKYIFIYMSLILSLGGLALGQDPPPPPPTPDPCSWTVTVTYVHDDVQDDDYCEAGSRGRLRGTCEGGKVYARAYAVDSSSFCYIRVYDVALAEKRIDGVFTPGEMCSPYTSGTHGIHISGQVDLANATCRAAALGYMEIVSNIPSLNRKAELKDSAGDSGGSTGVSIGGSSAGPSISYNINFGQGLGRWVDKESAPQLPFSSGLSVITFALKGKVISEAYANGGWGGLNLASTTLEMEGTQTLDYDFGFTTDPQ